MLIFNLIPGNWYLGYIMIYDVHLIVIHLRVDAFITWKS